MKPRMNVALVTALVAAAGWSQEINVSSTTIAQMWKQETPGFEKTTMAPATQFLEIDATKLGDDALSLHLFGWGQTDLKDSSEPGDKSRGHMSAGYLKYRFAQANAEVKAGRFAVTQGGGVENVDGVSLRADLRGGFAISAFGGKPVRYETTDPISHRDYKYQRDVIFGTRLSYWIPKIGELGLSYLQDGSEAAEDLTQPSVADFTRKQIGLDMVLTPIATVNFSGRTLFDIANHPDTPAGTDSPSRIAEHDYNVAVKVVESVSVSGGYVERNFRAFFAGSNLPSLFRQDEKGKFRAYTGSVNWGINSDLRVVADFRHTKRETYGEANRFGAEVRWNLTKWKIQTGAGIHRVSADDTVSKIDPATTYGLSHTELRGWAMWDGGFYFASADGIYQKFTDKNNPNLYRKDWAAEAVASGGIRPNESLKVSADMVVATNAYTKKEVRGLVRVEYRFGMAGKGGRK
jgi:hypothetical protein